MKKLYLLLLLIIIFSYIAFKVSNSSFEVDLIVNQWTTTINNSEIFKKLFIVIARLWDTYWVIIITSLISLYFLHKKYFLEIFTLIFTMTLTVTSSTIIKHIVARIRPENMIIDYSWYSFPSWHSTMAILFYWMLFFLINKKTSNTKIKTFFAIFFIIFSTLIIFSRIYLSVHWFSDVIWWIILWTIWLIIWIQIYYYFKNKKFLCKKQS